MGSDSVDNVVKQSKNIVHTVQTFVEENIREIRGGIYITAGCIALYMARKIRLISVFNKVEDIPAHFIKRKVQLRGVVKDMTDDGALCVHHIPILRVPFVKRKEPELLKVNLACIDITPSAYLWLDSNMLGKTVWIHLLHRTERDGVYNLYCKVVMPRMLKRNLKVNEELVKKGLCKISPLSVVEDLKMSDNPNMVKYLDKLVQLEHKAASLGYGMWTASHTKSPYMKGMVALGNVLVSPIYAVRWIRMIFRRLRRRSQKKRAKKAMLKAASKDGTKEA